MIIIICERPKKLGDILDVAPQRHFKHAKIARGNPSLCESIKYQILYFKFFDLLAVLATPRNHQPPPETNLGLAYKTLNQHHTFCFKKTSLVFLLYTKKEAATTDAHKVMVIKCHIEVSSLLYFSLVLPLHKFH